MKNISRLIPVVLVLCFVTSIWAGKHGSNNPCCCKTECPRCDHVCELSVDLEDEAKSCYCVEEKAVCIPRFVFPWQNRACSGSPGCDDGCDGNCNGGVDCSRCNNGACIKYVRVLKKFEYKCKVCKYEWNAELPDCCADGCCDNGCDVGVEANHEHESEGEGHDVPTAPPEPTAKKSIPKESLLGKSKPSGGKQRTKVLKSAFKIWSK